jgi:hypothetical protein
MRQWCWHTILPWQWWSLNTSCNGASLDSCCFNFHTRDVNLHPLVGISVEIAPFGAPKMGIFSPWGRGWRQNLPRWQFGAGIGEGTSVPADSPNPPIYLTIIYYNNIYIYIYIIYSNNIKYWFFVKTRKLKKLDMIFFFG